MARTLDELLEIKKAFEANPGITDLKDLQDGSALSRQYIDGIMSGIVATDDDFTFVRELPKTQVDQVIVEYNQMRSHGGADYWRTSHVTQSGDPHFADAFIKRKWDEMSYLAEGFRFNRVIKKVNNIADPEVVQSTAATRRMLVTGSRSIWHGDKATLSVEMNGLITKTEQLGSEFIIDCRGQLPTHDMINDAANRIRTRYFGLANRFYMPFGTKSLFDQAELGDKQFLFTNAVADAAGVLASRVVKGARVTAAKNQLIEYIPDMWLDRSNISVPVDLNRATEEYEEMSVGKNPPGMPTITVDAVAGPVPGSKWETGDAGTVAYRVAAMSGEGSSVASLAVSATIGAGGAATITITHAVSGGPVESFVIMRETKPGNGVFRFVKRIKKNTGPTTVFVDLNHDLPGTSVGLFGDFNARGLQNEMSTISLLELMSPLKTIFPEGVGGYREFAGMVEWFPVIQNKAPEKFVVFKNLPVL